MTEIVLPAQAQAAADSYKQYGYAWFVFAIAGLFYYYEYFLRIAPSVMTNDLQAAFGGLSLAAFGSLAACYYYAYTPMQLLVGILIDRFNIKYLLTLACLICALGTYLFAATEHVYIAALAHAMMGFGSAFAFVSVLSLSAMWLPQKHFGLASGLTMLLGMLSGMQGAVLLTKLVNLVGWRNALIFAGHAGICLAVIIYFFVEEKKSPALIKNFATNHCKNLILDLKNALTNRTILQTGCIGAFLYFSLSIFAELWGVSYFEFAYHLSKIAAAKMVALVFLGWAIGAPIVGYFADRLNQQNLFIVICSLGAALFSALFLFLPLGKLGLSASVFLYGFFCSANILGFSVGVRHCAKEKIGIAIATINMLGMLGGMIFQPIIGKGLDILLHAGISAHAAYTMTLCVLPLAALVSAWLGCKLPAPLKHS